MTNGPTRTSDWPAWSEKRLGPEIRPAEIPGGTTIAWARMMPRVWLERDAGPRGTEARGEELGESLELGGGVLPAPKPTGSKEKAIMILGAALVSSKGIDAVSRDR